jgi:hypothetical protein
MFRARFRFRFRFRARVRLRFRFRVRVQPPDRTSRNLHKNKIKISKINKKTTNKKTHRLLVVLTARA